MEKQKAEDPKECRCERKEKGGDRKRHKEKGSHIRVRVNAGGVWNHLESIYSEGLMGTSTVQAA